MGSNAVAPEFTCPVAELEQTHRLRDALDQLAPDAPVTVVGDGLTGIEMAAGLAGPAVTRTVSRN